MNSKQQLCLATKCCVIRISLKCGIFLTANFNQIPSTLCLQVLYYIYLTFSGLNMFQTTLDYSRVGLKILVIVSLSP